MGLAIAIVISLTVALFIAFFVRQRSAEIKIASEFSDTGRKKKQQSRIHQAIEQILNVFPEPTIIINSEGLIKYFNKSFLKSFSLDSEQASQYLYDIFREPQILSLVQGAQKKSDAMKMDIQITMPSSQIKKNFTIFKTPYSIRNDDETLEQMIVFHDVTLEKKTDQMKTDFVSNVSHELRTPLMAIKGYVEALKEDVRSKKLDQIDKYFEVIESNVDRLSFLVSDLLELSYLESDLTLEKKWVDIKELTKKITQQFQLDFEKGGYEINTQFQTDKVFGDARLIEQVLINLVQNTLRYTPQKTQIHICWSKNDNETALSFKDNGPGISEEHLARIFERFYRVDPHRSRAHGGTGLGLSIVKHIMQRHGGSVHVASQMGYGIQFECSFPSENKNIS